MLGCILPLMLSINALGDYVAT